MGYFSDLSVATMEEFGSQVDGFVGQIAPMLSECFCDESTEELLEIWADTRRDFDDDVLDYFEPPWTRQDAYYVNELLGEFKSFVLVSMENDW